MLLALSVETGLVVAEATVGEEAGGDRTTINPVMFECKEQVNV